VAFIGDANAREFYRTLADNVARSFGGDADRLFDDMMNGRLPGGLAAPEPGAAAGGAAEATPSAPRLDGFIDRIVRIESEQLAGQQVKNAAATRSVGGWAIMFLLFSVSGAATSLFEEKKAGLFLRLLAAPVLRSHILWSKYLFCMGLGLVQLTALFFAGRLLFGIDVTSNFGNLLLICFAASAACTAFGMLLAAIARSPAAASGLATFLVLTMSAVGGAWFPTSFMPEFMQTLSTFTIVYWAMEGFVQVLWADCTLTELLPTLGVLLGIAVVVNAVSVWRFNRGDLFV
jgi:ABC-2 type transport system permease protein